MSDNCCPISDPISSTQVTTVDLMKPKCASFCGNDLNSWLKFLADNTCQCDWENYDLSPLFPLMEREPTDVTQCVVIDSIVESIVSLNEQVSNCCDETEYSIPEVDWTPTRPLRALRKGRQVTLTGAAIANSSYTVDIAQLPTTLYPSTNLYIPVAHDFAPSASYNLFLRILPTGEIRLNFSGTTPDYGAARTVYLDGVTFFLN